MFKSLRSRLILSYVLVILLTLCIAGAGLLLLLQDFQRGILTQRLSDALGPNVAQARNLLRRGTEPDQVVLRVQEQVQENWRVLLVNEQSFIMADSKSELVGRKLPRALGVQNVTPVRFVTGRQTVGGRDLLYAAAPITIAGRRDFLVLA